MPEDTNYICSECVTDNFLSIEIVSDGTVQTCCCCDSEENRCWSLEDLSARVKEVFDDNYELTPSEPDMYQQMLLRDKESDFEWYREGETAVSIVEDLVGLPTSLCEDVVDLWDGDTYYDHKDSYSEQPYGSDALYEFQGYGGFKIEQKWREIQDELLHRSRFFSHTIHRFLEGIFAGVQSLNSGGDPVVVTYQPAEFPGIYRARVAYGEDGVSKILVGLPNELGVLRGRSVAAGRMNAAGVSVMYGALEEETCVAEVRAPVGSLVVTGKFKIKRPIRILNLKSLEKCYKETSPFDPNVLQLTERMFFLRSLSRRLSVPVFNHEAHLDYLATQCIAEYIASLKPDIDGIAFESAQAGGDAMNLVLFDRACHIDPWQFPVGTEVNAEVDEEDGYLDRRLVFRQPTAAQSADAGLENTCEDWSSEQITERRDQRIPAPTLELDRKSVRVLKVNSVKYDTTPNRVRVEVRDNPTGHDLGNLDF